ALSLVLNKNNRRTNGSFATALLPFALVKRRIDVCRGLAVVLSQRAVHLSNCAAKVGECRRGLVEHIQALEHLFPSRSSDQLNCWSDYLIKFKIDRLKLASGRKNKQPTSAVLWFELLCQRERDARAPSADVVLF